MRPTRVFIAMPYEGEDQVANVGRAIDVAEDLLDLGYAPFVPHLCHLWQLKHGHGVKTWYRLQLAWLPTADCVVAGGISQGVVGEMKRAKDFGIPVFRSVDELLASGIPKEMDDDSWAFGETKALGKLRENL